MDVDKNNFNYGYIIAVYGFNKKTVGVLSDIVIRNSDLLLKEAQNPKIRTTVFLEENLIRALKQEAIEHGIKYQQLMRDKLKESMINQNSNPRQPPNLGQFTLRLPGV